jgi:MFS family permease
VTPLASATLAPDRTNVPAGKEALRVIVACTIGSILEWYDFFVFATAAVLVFNTAFFPTYDPLVGVLLGMMTYGAGFLSRPIGGFVFGYIGDRFGRKLALYWSLILMGAATAAMGLIPGYASIGVAAPLLLVTLRMIQGFAVGGEVGGAALLVSESLDTRHRAFWIAGPLSGAPFGNALGAAVLTVLTGTLSAAAFAGWGWRVAFLLSLPLVFFGSWLRMNVEESPIYIEARKKALARKGPKPTLFQTLARHPKAIVLMLLLRLGENTLFYIFTTFIVVYGTTVLHMPRQVALTALLIASIVEGILLFATGIFSDRYGRRLTMAIGFILGGIWIFVMFPIAGSGIEGALLLAALGGAVAHSFIAMGEVPMMVEIFPTEARYTGFSASYQIGSLLSGAIAPSVGVALLNWYGTAVAVSVYCALTVCVSLVAVMVAPETNSRNLAYKMDR